MSSKRTLAKLRDALRRAKLCTTASFPGERCLLNYEIKDLYIRSEAGLSVLKCPLNYKLLLDSTVLLHSSYPSIAAVPRTLVKINNINPKPYLRANKQL